MATVETSDKTPEWMLLLEKKTNRPHRLAHEIGAGAPCLACGDKCPGLDLHFWRKLCRNCKCKKEEHDVIDDDGRAQFEILLGAGSKRKKPGAVLKFKDPDIKTNAVVESKKSVPFDWVPPNVSDDIAAEYMEKLPAAKLPISGSDGALYRRQQLERQMPLHDLDATRCHNLTPQEIEELQKYLANIKNNVVGQGRVDKVPTLYSEQRLTYRGPNQYNTSGGVLHSSQSDQSLHQPHQQFNALPRPFRPLNTAGNLDDLPPPLPTSLPPAYEHSNLKTPGSFIPSSTNTSGHMQGVARSTAVPGQMNPGTSVYGSKAQDGSQHPANAAYSTDTSGQMHDMARSTAVPGQMYPGTSVYGSKAQDGSQHPANAAYSTDTSGQMHDMARSTAVPGQMYPGTSVYGSKAQDGSQHPANAAYSTDTSGQMQEMAHSTAVPAGQMYPGTSVYGSKAQDGSQHSANAAYSTDTAGQHDPRYNRPSNTLHHSTGGFPLEGALMTSQHESSLAVSSEVPQKGVPGFSRNLAQHGDPTLQAHDHPKSYKDSINVAKKDSSQDSGRASEVPHQFNPGQNPYHAQNKDTFPVDGTKFNYNNNNDVANSTTLGQTGPNFSHLNQSNHAGGANTKLTPENMNSADFQSINEPWLNPSQIAAAVRYEYSVLPYDLAGSSTVASDGLPHSATIIQQSGLMTDDLAAQMELLSAEEHPVMSHLSCKQCAEPLVAGEVAVFADRAGDNTAWHPKCFVCNTCDELLVDLVYFFCKGNVYCGRHFAELLDIPRCFACDELIFVKEYTVAEGKTFHVKHFCCYECDIPLAGKQYIPAEDQPTCLNCYQDIFGKRCHTCRKQIAAGKQRIGWKELNWHADEDCFRCNGCSKSLLGGRFVMKDQQPYCNKECVLTATS